MPSRADNIGEEQEEQEAAGNHAQEAGNNAALMNPQIVAALLHQQQLYQQQQQALLLSALAPATFPQLQPNPLHLQSLLLQAQLQQALQVPQPPLLVPPAAMAAVAPAGIAVAPTGVAARSNDPNKPQRMTTGPEFFPERLLRLLEEVEREGRDDIIGFTPSGAGFWVHQPDRFVSEIMPLYFKQTKWGSFARQLRLYGFRKGLEGEDPDAYFHEHFHRGRTDLLHLIRRKGKDKSDQDE